MSDEKSQGVDLEDLSNQLEEAELELEVPDADEVSAPETSPVSEEVVDDSTEEEVSAIASSIVTLVDQPVGNLCSLITALSGTRTKSGKESLLRDNDSGALRWLLRQCYDPFITFGITDASLVQAEQKLEAELEKVVQSTASSFNSVEDGVLDVQALLKQKVVEIETEMERPVPLLISRLDDLLRRLERRELTGKLAESETLSLYRSSTPDDRKVMRRIFARTLDNGVGPETVSRVFPGLLNGFEVMLSKPYSAKRIKKFPMWAEEKIDGYRAICIVDLVKGATLEETATNSMVKFLSREGKSFPSMVSLAPAVLRAMEDSGVRQFVFDGEVRSVKGSFNETASTVRKRAPAEDDELVFSVFDGLTVDEFTNQNCALNLKERRARLRSLFAFANNFKLHPGYWVNSDAEIQLLFARVLEGAGEGLVVKNPNSLYEFKRSFNWMKLKAEETLDIRIVGAYEGEGKYKGKLGGFRCEMPGGKITDVGGGFTDDQRARFWRAYLDGFIEGRLIEVEYHEITDDGALRHGRFKRFRDDKDGETSFGGSW